MEHPIGALPMYTLCLFEAFQRGNEGYEEKNRGVICFMYYSAFPPLVAGATTFPPQFGGAARKAP